MNNINFINKSIIVTKLKNIQYKKIIILFRM